MTDIIMSFKETNRINILEQLIRKEISQQTAATALGLTTRQVRRVMRKYRKNGVAGLAHLGRGKVSNRKINSVEINRAISIIREKYIDFGPTFALEKLTKHHGITFGVDTLRIAMIREGLWHPHRRKIVRPHQLRQRRDCEGELVQIDGSPFRWLEDRGSVGMCTLLVASDDATSNLEHLLLVDCESTQNYFTFTKGYLEARGKPLTWYSDKHGVFRKASKQGENCAEDSQGLTQFGRAMEELHIKMIFANSPQAKGRVERANNTLQDRLTKELRLRGISTLKAANTYLPEFRIDYNSKYGVKPKNPTNMHRLLNEEEKGKLADILLEKNVRIVSKNLTIHYDNLEYQIQTQRPGYTLRKATIEVWKDIHGLVRLIYQGKELPYQIYQTQPKAEVVDSKRINQVVDNLKHQRYQSYFDKLREQNWENYQQV